MDSLRRTVNFIIALPFVVFLVLFVGVGIFNGFGEALEITFQAPRDLFCSLTGLCDVETEETFVREEDVYTRIWTREVLVLRDFEMASIWRKTRSVAFAEASMRMSAEANVTLGVNLATLTVDDVVVDNDANTVTITMPPVQPVDCFLVDVEFFDEVCLGQCDELRADLREQAILDAVNSEALATEFMAAFEEAQFVIGGLIDPLAEDYSLIFLPNTDVPAPIAGSECPAP